jgi:hypothetical protein
VLQEGIAEIADSAFASCHIKEVVLPVGLQKIHSYAFYDTPALTHIELPNSVVYIGRGAFAKSGVRRFSFPPRIRTIAGELFWRSALEAICYRNGNCNLSVANALSERAAISIPAACVDDWPAIFEKQKLPTSDSESVVYLYRY